jgi:lysophospholipase
MTEPQNPGEQANAGSEIHYGRGHVITRDQLDIVWQAWTPETAKGVIVIIHGLSEHSGRYQETAEALSSEGWAVYSGDLRAHGLSSDPPKAGRVHVDRFEDYFHDVEAFINLARSKHRGLPLFILGHSMGGLISIRYVLEYPEGIAGAVISSPLLGTHPEFKPPLALRLLVKLLSAITPRALFKSDLDTEAISRDPDVVKAYIDDPLVTSKVSARWYNEAMKSVKKAHKNAPALRIPMLLMQSGSDRLVDPDATRIWAEATPDGRVEFVLWEGLYHEMFNEPENEKVRERTLSWLQSQISKSRAAAGP